MAIWAFGVSVGILAIAVVIVRRRRDTKARDEWMRQRRADEEMQELRRINEADDE